MRFQQPDSTNLSQPAETTINQQGLQTTPIEENSLQSGDTLSSETIIPRNTIIRRQAQPKPVVENLIPVPNTDTIVEKKIKTELYKPFTLYRSTAEKDSSVVDLKSGAIFQSGADTIIYTGPKPLSTHKSEQKEWVFGITILSSVLFIVLRIYFQKYLSSVVTSAINIQIAEKLMREKNVIIRRVFALLNLNFAISSSLFIYLILSKFNIDISIDNSLIRFLIILFILAVFLFIRFLIILSIGGIFNSIKLFKEYLHNTYLINKNLGLYLLPLVISAFYLKQPFSDIAFYVSLVLVAISVLYKYIRAVQIIMRYNIFLFYTILYLCTLEILPVLVGIKFVLSLR